jgi:putative endonuclease
MVRARDGRLYAGITTDLARRLRQHNGELKGGAKALKGCRPVELVWTELHVDRSSASKREAQIKGLSKAKKEAMIVIES